MDQLQMNVHTLQVQVSICSSSWGEAVSSRIWVQGILYEGVLKVILD